MGTGSSVENFNFKEPEFQELTDRVQLNKWARHKYSNEQKEYPTNNNPSTSKYPGTLRNVNYEYSCCKCHRDLRTEKDVRILPCQKHRVCGPQSNRSCYTLLFRTPSAKCPAVGCGFPMNVRGANDLPIDRSLGQKIALEKKLQSSSPRRNTTSQSLEFSRKTDNDYRPNSWRPSRAHSVSSFSPTTSSLGKPSAHNLRKSEKRDNSNQRLPSAQTAAQPEAKASSTTTTSGYIRENVIANGKRKILVIGKTGVGKSTLCNALAGEDHTHTATLFPVSPTPNPKTSNTRFADVFFGGVMEKGLVSLIDTVGFDGQNEKDQEAKAIDNLVGDLKTKCDHIHLFLIIVNGQVRRAEGSLIAMLRLFEELFGEQFWKNVVIVFTCLKMDKGSRASRLANNGKDDKKLAEMYVAELKNNCAKLRTTLRFLFLDCHKVSTNSEENAFFEDQMIKLYNYLNDSSPVITNIFKSAVNRPSLDKTIFQKEMEKKKQEKEQENMMEQFEEFLKTLIGQSTKVLQDQFLLQQNELFEQLERRETAWSERERTFASEQLNKMMEEKEQLEAQFSDANKELGELRSKLSEQGESLEELRREVSSRSGTSLLETQRSMWGSETGKERTRTESDILERERMFSEIAKKEKELEEKSATISNLESKIEELTEQKMNKDRPEEQDVEELVETLLPYEENQQNISSFQQQYRNLTQKTAGIKEEKDNREAWRKTAKHMLQRITEKTSDSNPEASEKICKVLEKNFLGSSWFVYIITATKNWTWKVNKGDYQRWSGRTGTMSGNAQSGRPGYDLAIWGLICPDEGDEISYNYDIKSAMETIMDDAQSYPNENKALEAIVKQLNQKRIRWSFVLVAPNKTTSQSHKCHGHLLFTRKSNKNRYHIDIYLGL